MPPLPSYPEINMHPAPKPKRKFRLLLLLVLMGLVVLGSFYLVGRAPADFEPGTIVTIPPATSTKQAGLLLEQAHVIRSSSVFDFLIETLYRGKPVITGDFQFDQSVDVLQVVDRVTSGLFGAAQAKITIPEGSSNADIAKIIIKAIPSWNANEFTAKAKPYEGSLFPETYFVFKKITPAETIDVMRKEYDRQVAPLRTEMKSFGKSERDIVIMASLLEKEARNETEAKVIAGILWKRIKNGQALQVDAPFLYALGKTSEQLKASDLQKDGPYNTYTRRGLPAGPIGNPGIAMIIAAMRPESSPYLYYLHDKDGGIHYAKTYNEHLANKTNYLK